MQCFGNGKRVLSCVGIFQPARVMLTIVPTPSAQGVKRHHQPNCRQQRGLIVFLTDAELVELTGYKQASKQVAHLKAQRIPFHTNCAGHPRVARAVLEGRKVSEKTSKSWSPSWAGNRAAT